jgi:DNA-binding LacI/PurR family transcriptional regulator
MVKGAEDAARAAGFALVLFNTNEELAQERAHLETLQALRCDGALLICAPAVAEERARWDALEHFPLPLVAVDRAVPLPVDTVVADNAGGGHEAGRQLAKLGHRRIGLVTVDYEVSSHRDRRAGFHRALAEAKVERRKEYEVRVPLTVNDGFAGTSRLLDLAEPPTAIFVTSNALTIGTIGALQARGLRVPQDVSVVGYDSYDWQEVFQPRLTTVKQPSYLMGQRAAELLVARVVGKRKGAAEKVVLPTTLVVRDSCDVLRGGERG